MNDLPAPGLPPTRKGIWLLSDPHLSHTNTARLHDENVPFGLNFQHAIGGPKGMVLAGIGNLQEKETAHERG